MFAAVLKNTAMSPIIYVWGSAGGANGGTNGLAVARGNGQREAYAFVSGLVVEPGDEILIGTANGGGWGKPGWRLFLLQADAWKAQAACSSGWAARGWW